ncbi:LysR family transcriptional regulator [Pseudoalteromonas sp. MB41]|uniref:LysR family transcriptional regulator n=1 Tax=Pseudoalteromonas sp. MB41 TaxID=2896366 RepID=UPI001E2F8470|nr:LysR family transcriptional regulator [Pseudoalteromonas sp. MB41]MCC9662089.1 LysR family transcriptional regulator [Pseudoalteromonas sp. MB41]
MVKNSIIPKPITEYDLRLLRIFRVVVENGGFAAAENELGVTRSTISLHMSNLEARMKLKLCLRGRGGFSLTQEGQAVYHAALGLFESLDDFSLLVGSLGHELSGELVILCADQSSPAQQNKLAEVIRYIHKKAPNLHLVLDAVSIHEIEKALLRDKAHLGIYPSYQQVEGLRYEALSSEAIYLCCSDRHPFFNLLDSEINSELLSQSPAVHPGIDIDTNGREQLKKLNLAAKSYQFDSRKTMIMSGCYLGYMPQSYIQQELNEAKMRIIKPSSLIYQFDLSLVYKKNPKEQKKVELVQAAIKSAFQY